MTITTKRQLNEFQVHGNAVVAGVRSTPHVIELSNGNILMAWEQGNQGSIDTSVGIDVIGTVDAVDTGTVGTLVGTLYDAEGHVIRDGLQLNCDRSLHNHQDNHQDFDIAATQDGGFILVYVSADSASPRQPQLHWKRFNHTGTALSGVRGGGILVFETLDGTVLSHPQIAVNPFDSSFVVTYVEHTDTSTHINARIVNNMGAVICKFSAYENGHDFKRSGQVARLVNGNFVSVSETHDVNSPGIAFKIFTPLTGVLINQVYIDVGDVGDVGTAPQVASLSNGNFVIVYRVDNAINYRLYTPMGTPVSNSRSVGLLENTYTAPKVLALPDNHFVIVWDNETDNCLEAQRFDQNGFMEGARFIYHGIWRHYPTKYWCFWRWSYFVYLSKIKKIKK